MNYLIIDLIFSKRSYSQRRILQVLLTFLRSNNNFFKA